MHQRPDAAHITACRPWLAAEPAAVRPRVVVAMGAVVASSLFGPGFRVTQARGVALRWPPESGPLADSPVPVEAAVAVVHPSSVLRGEPAQRDEMLAGLVSDLRVALPADRAALNRRVTAPPRFCCCRRNSFVRYRHGSVTN